MKTLRFTTHIAAPQQTVWQTMLEPDTYKIWTAEFAEGSYYEGALAEGQKIRFMAPRGGIVSMVATYRPAEFISFKHIGMVKDGVEDTESEAVRAWAPSFENYTFTRVGDGTELRVDLDITPEYEDYMNNIWPKALARLKMLCERR